MPEIVVLKAVLKNKGGYFDEKLDICYKLCTSVCTKILVLK